MEYDKIPINKNEKILPRAAVIEDMSGFGRVSLTEAIPILSAMGIEACPLPTAVLSTHTYEFTDYTILDMTDEMEKIIAHWESINLNFDAIYSGYLASRKQTEIIFDFMKKQKKAGAYIVCDPVLGDNSLLDVQVVYSKRMADLIEGMRKLCSISDVITPNLTEACLLLDKPFSDEPLSNSEISDMCSRLLSLGSKAVVITSIMTTKSSMCVAVSNGKDVYKIDCDFVPRKFHGTGDIFTSVLTGAYLNKNSLEDSSLIASDFVKRAIDETLKYPDMPIRHGVLFEPILKSGYFAKNDIKLTKEKI